MKKILLASILTLLVSLSVLAGSPEADLDLSWYHATYPFYSMPDTFFTIEGEFGLPDGYHRPDSASLSDFQYWISHFPIWVKGKSVGKYQGQRLHLPTEISRVWHLPWQSRFFTDRAIPVRILGEYLVYKKRESDCRLFPKKGALLTYDNWLKGRPVYNGLKEIILEPYVEREAGPEEFYPYLLTCMKNTSYSSLIKNCDTITAEVLAPGDLYIGHSADDHDGFVFVVMNRFDDNAGNHLFLIGRGEDPACDFYIPLVNGDRDKPWLTARGIEELAPRMDFAGFFRLKTK